MIPSKLNLVIIEDSPDDAQLLVHKLSKAGHSLNWTRVETEAEFLESLWTGVPDLILSDHSMPQFSGIRAAELLKERGLDIPFILVSGTIGEEAAVEIMRRGATDYVLKDRIARLPSVVERALEQKQLRDSRRRAEAELRSTHARLRHLLEHSPAVIYTLRIEADQVVPHVVSESIEKLFGYTQAETLLPAWWRDTIHPEDRDEATANAARVLEDGSGTLVFRLRHKNGAYCWVEDIRNVVRDEAGRPLEVVGVVTDISERKRAELHITLFARLGKQLSSTKTAAEAGAIIVRVADQLFGWDACTLDLYSASKNRIQHVLNWDTVGGQRRSFPPVVSETPPTPRAQKVILEGAQLILRQPPFAFEEGLPFGDEDRASASLMVVPIRHEASVVGFFSVHSYRPNAYTPQDLNELQALADHCAGALDRIQAESALHASEEHLRQAQKLDLIGQLASGVAHDFNNVLAVISGLASMIRINPHLDAEVLEAADQMVQAVERGAGLTRQLLAFSRKQVAGQLRELDVNEVISGLTKMLARVLGAGVALQVKPGAALPLVRSDAVMLQQVLLNLTVNARDAMLAGGQVNIESSTTELMAEDPRLNPGAAPGQYVCITVSDTGCGIPSDLLEKIFEPFFTTKAPGQGTGLGLATVLSVAQQHGGWVRVQSQINIGTSFQVFLPASRTQDHGNPSGISASGPLPGAVTILVAEDEAPLRKLISKVLQREGYHVLEADSGSAALGLWQQHYQHINLLLTDMMMPGGLSGKELASRLLAQAPDLKVIYHSAYGPGHFGPDLTLREGENYLQKPYSVTALADLVRTALERKA